LSDGLLETPVKPGLKDWQNNQIRTLADLQSSALKRAEQWLKKAIRLSSSTLNKITWFNSKKSQPELAEGNRSHLSKVPDTQSSLGSRMLLFYMVSRSCPEDDITPPPQ